MQIGRYTIVGKLGEGGMGAVFKAADPDLMREVAIKVIRPEVVADQSIRVRFNREARAAGMMKHPGIVTVYDFGDVGGQPYIVMELVEGLTLDRMIAGGPMPLDRALPLLRQVASALDYAHARQVVHRDIKPANIIVQSDGTSKIMDFGIATTELGAQGLTALGTLAGSPHFVPPERYTSGAVSGLTDQWALAVTAFQVLTGQMPFQADNLERLIYKICHEPAMAPASINKGIPKSASAALLKALSKKPEERFENCSRFVAALGDEISQSEKAAAVPPPRHSRQIPKAPVIAGGIAAGLALAAVVWMNLPQQAGFVATQQQPEQPQSATGREPILPATFESPAGDMILVPAGDARLGNGASQTVPVDAFYIDKTEVSVGAFRRFCQETGRGVDAAMEALPANMPAVNVAWDEARAFAVWAGKRLPTASEWEKAARGASGQALPWGANAGDAVANIPIDAKQAASARLSEVTSFPGGASPYGALNMLGNVWEWTGTAAAAPPAAQLERYRKLFHELEPPLAETDLFYQARGGSYRYDVPASAWGALIWDFNPMPARARRPDVGFRCAKDAR